MKRRCFRPVFVSFLLAGVLAGAGCVGRVTPAAPAAPPTWITAWTTAPLAETPGKDTPELRDATLRQVVRTTAAGSAMRVRIGNYFGAEPLVIGGARIGPADRPQVDSSAWRHVRFSGADSVSIPPGAAVVSDPIDVAVTAGTDWAVALHVVEIPKVLTGHSAARAHSYVTPGNDLGLPPAADEQRKFTRWYFLCGIDVVNPRASAIAVLGDSITDGYGIPHDSYSRWPDGLARRLQANPATAHFAVLNLGIGGNRLLRNGLGPSALSRVERDVFSQHGVTTLIVFMGINDIGTRVGARKKNQPFASRDDIIGALRQIAAGARDRGIKVVGGTITPYRGSTSYWSEDGEADRKAVNAWIRTSGEFDAVIDFDAALRDPSDPDRLAPAFDCGDHLHPSVAGYAEMARIVDLNLLARLAAKPAEPRPAAAR